MKNRERDVARVEEAFILSRTRRGEPEIGDLWQQRAMAHILEASASREAPALNGSFRGATVWRFTAASFLLVLILAGLLVDMRMDVQYQTAEVIFWDSTGLDLPRSFGVL